MSIHIIPVYDQQRLSLKLLSQVGPSGDEGRASRVWREEAENFAEKVYTDTHGNTYAEFGDGKPTLMLAGHIDEIGLMVQYIDDNGFVYIAVLGVGIHKFWWGRG
jgi:Cellulase M and related proteins